MNANEMGRRASRLDIFIARMEAQKAFIEMVAGMIDGVEGPIFELGLGNGRTFDHLREILPGREIFVFDRSVTAHPASIPDGDHMIIGEIRDTLAFCAPRVGCKAALIHCDLGTGDPTADLAKAAWLAPLIKEHVAPGGYVATGIALDMDGFEEIPRSEAAELGRYWLYHKPK
ncbi:class I SAM-dependent methyltransferase [Acuticoccus sp. M5D2P5]|uniref:class I SAM-dependent methyltransferase n=1 Tax=Acuticoccus kalidii TaxID=2910977 RepID=UPI001F43DE2C|nr:class I SAM-dependent methyltransferase [Acuticoccus kalidii]MCF3936498.1 class I SAM-dependent methyltransferase [Acuticoccus kalidii]